MLLRTDAVHPLERRAEGEPAAVADLPDDGVQRGVGRNSSLADGVERALNRKPRDFADWVAEIAPTGVGDAA
ncbi:hypothetical protein FHR33_000541 [Nonomuraea dietziae]|uniref:Uncharacterized protein n=1 Tax=Nonomuraea dietziae TaxID=65515 RepID=A0A7W5UU77_9ACTN|nr:hypothetical protein [Nonomuraea dietziae]